MLIEDGLELLPEPECRALLSGESVGRVGMTVGALPVILPVNYAYVDGDIVFRTGEGTKLRAAAGGAVVAFEIDAYDVETRRGWSVLAIGRVHEVTSAAELTRLGALPLAPWANGAKSHYVCLHPELVTGRRIAGG